MDTQQFMEEFVARQTEQAPEKAFLDPQVELLTQMSREADLDNQVTQLEKQSGEGSSSDGNTGEGEQESGEVPEILAESVSDSPEAEANEISESSPLTIEPVAPSEEAGPSAEPNPPEVFQTEPAEPTEPQETAGPDAEPTSPFEFQTPPAVITESKTSVTPPAEPVAPHEVSTPAEIEIPSHLRSQDFLPEGVSSEDFDAMLSAAQKQASVPQLDYHARGGDAELLKSLPDLPGLPEFEDIRTQPSTDFADAKLGSLSLQWRQWERN